ncbi:MAG: hypothetical protein OZ921_17325 [Sorangiineae bacterium]|nr:hypothetical protein [Polyangiaceae bacterium]MEB2324279.1 hypothetical protein [Sorangiineae bacterium]
MLDPPVPIQIERQQVRVPVPLEQLARLAAPDQLGTRWATVAEL